MNVPPKRAASSVIALALLSGCGARTMPLDDSDGGELVSDAGDDGDADADADDVAISDADADDVAIADADSPVDSQPFVITASAGSNHTCALTDDGAVWCWGYNFYGELGDGTTEMRIQPVEVPLLEDVSGIASGAAHNCAWLRDGTARCWGWGEYGQLGDGDTTDRFEPVQVRDVVDIVGLSAGWAHTCAWLADGTAWCWGENGRGELGSGLAGDQALPVRVSGISDVVGITSGASHSCAWLGDGTAMCWGYNGEGRLGDGTAEDRHTPVAVVDLSGVAQVTSRWAFSCALTEGRTLCWGWLPDRIAHEPEEMLDFLGVTTLTASAFHLCAMLADALPFCWGVNTSGQLGSETITDFGEIAGPYLVDLHSVDGMVAGNDHNCAWLTDGSLWCWGANDYGQLGAGEQRVGRAEPNQVVF